MRAVRAQQAGIIAGDIITKVNGQDVGSMELSEVVAMIKGEAGTTVDITVYRDREELDFTVGAGGYPDAYREQQNAG